MAQRAIGSPTNIYVKEGKVAISFHLHDELNDSVDTVQVVKEVLQLVGSMWPDDKRVIHVMKPLRGLWASWSSAISSKPSMKKLAMTGYSGEPTVTPSICS
jgi:hypothetical protein